ncbi:putative ABC transporter ATP-binding protein [Clostridium homopropionicum DSM 5847]|uniref:Putative ABC transporter ATP-binding protein n=2 Tax=Clostridium TaxID=1485 RepID=A0A0L6Z547_9CLOT|nr:putative ABC transporter ATP-binding protein [Clostridium homopropionicum DSM 5847]SFG71547.1 ABC-type multidrug transport system, ATPase and permease component [Clostridium homopropionicum]
MSEDRKRIDNAQMGGRRGGPMGQMGRPVEKAKDFKGTFKRLLRYLRPHRINLIIVLIFAILSTLFTISAPKITSKAMNKLQDAYMARKMISEMSKGQTEAVNKMKDKMGDVQIETVDKINEKMIEGQKKAVDQITKSMGDAQVTAVNEIYKNMAIQLHQGVVSGQKTAVDKITSQMALVQKGLIAQMQKSSTQMPQQVDAKTIDAIQKLMKLPMIDSISDRQTRIETTIKFIDILESMPANGQIDTKSLASAKELLSLPMLDSVKNSQEKINIIKKFMAMAKDMPGSSTSMQLDTNTMNKALAKIPEIKDFSTTSSSKSTNKMNQKEIDSVEKLMKLPMINEIKDAKEKRSTLIQLIDIFKNMPNTSGASTTASSGSQFNSTDLQTIQELLALPDISSIKDPNEKTAAVIKLVDVFSKMPDMNKDNAKSDEMMNPEQLKNVQQLLKLPMLDKITDSTEKTNVLSQMLDIFSKMPDMGTTTDKTNSEDKFDSKSIKSVQEFIALPRLDTLKDANQKADVAKKILDLSKEMEGTMDNASTSAKDNVKLTDDQINSAITAIRETNGEYDFHYIGVIALILIGMYIISAIFSLIMGLVMSGVAQKTVRDLRREVDDKLTRLPLKYFDSHPHGDILSRVTNDVDTIATTLQQSLTQIITSVITIIGYIIMMLTISPILTLIVIATMPLYVISTALIAKKSQKYFSVQQKELGQLSGHVEEMYTGHKIVKAFGHEKDSIEKFEAINDRLKDAGWRAQFVSGVMFPLMNFISNLGYVGISIVGGLWITKSLLGLGDILAFIQYSRSFTMPIVQTANIANVIQSTIACAERVFQILDEEEELADSKEAVVLENPRGDVTFEHVDFRYKEDVPLIEDMNLDIKQGHTIAIVGPTGAGKTTLVNLLMRFYEINSGKISIDGVNIKDIKRSELRKMFGMVLQDTWLYNGTIKDNIAYGKEGSTMEEIVRAAKAAHADHFIRTLPQGYDTVLNEEATNISQGQKQLLTIARAILADPTILILDEATSSVDTRTEVLIQKAMANLMEGRTSFVIAHRLSTIRDAELILVMDKGRVIEMGNHKELISKGGFYANLYNSQFTNSEEAV